MNIPMAEMPVTDTWRSMLMALLKRKNLSESRVNSTISSSSIISSESCRTLSIFLDLFSSMFVPQLSAA